MSIEKLMALRSRSDTHPTCRQFIMGLAPSWGGEQPNEIHAGSTPSIGYPTGAHVVETTGTRNSTGLSGAPNSEKKKRHQNDSRQTARDLEPSLRRAGFISPPRPPPPIPHIPASPAPLPLPPPPQATCTNQPHWPHTHHMRGIHVFQPPTNLPVETQIHPTVTADVP
jgi:hypothetical protein